MQNLRASRTTLILAGLILAAGFGLRILSFGWNTRIKGDINLMALTAREFVQHNRLYYPLARETPDMKAFITLDPLGMPATQHPPMYPFLAGAAGKLAGSDDTFTMLKMLDELGGLAMVIALLWMGLRSQDHAAAWLAAGAMTAAAPLFVDFSSNGSPYILVTLCMLLAILLIRGFRMERLRDYALAGLICGVGLQFHSIVAGLPAAFVVLWIVERKQLHWAGIGVFVATIALTMAPWVGWSIATMGTVMRPPSANYIQQTLHITSYSQMLEPKIAQKYLALIGRAMLGFARGGFGETGPFLLILALTGVFFLFRRDRRMALAIVLPAAAYMMVVMAWPSYKFRFLVPALIPLAVAAGFGFAHLPDLFPKTDRVARAGSWLLLAGSIGWSAPVYFNTPPTHYYARGEEANVAKQYVPMRSLAIQMRQREPGVMMGVATALDQGIDTVYWSRLPYVQPGGAASIETLRARAATYHVRYLWVDANLQKNAETAFPEAKIILREGPFLVYEINSGG